MLEARGVGGGDAFTGRTEREHPSALSSTGVILSTKGGQVEASGPEPCQMLVTANVQACMF